MDEQRDSGEMTATSQRTEVAVLAGGCFWGVEEILRDVPGVIETDVGTRADGSRTRRMTTRATASQDTPSRSA